MVRVFYEPPPGGPRTHLNRGPYFTEGLTEPIFIKKLQKMPPSKVIIPFVGTVAALCYIPLMFPKNMPVTLNPEHQAAQRAYMRYHNMNPITGISSKQARAADPDP
eukprot:Nitzschia sp. Nitz4//scaffold94_size78252//50625//51015//NITZ4_005473-RA/size78252-augustus-gene-0.73-mRNA-1//-1//CDS//3329560395//4877//frame0